MTLPKLPADYPYPIVIAIHMPDTFTKSFAEHLNSDSIIIYIPSANLLLSSCAKIFKENTCGIVMTGMGDDGSKGIVDVKKNGGITVAEDPKSAILWAMPENAIKTGCVDFVLKKDEIPEFLVKIAK